MQRTVHGHIVWPIPGAIAHFLARLPWLSYRVGRADEFLREFLQEFIRGYESVLDYDPDVSRFSKSKKETIQ